MIQVYKFIWIISGLLVNNKRINNNIHTKIVMALTSCDNTVITYRWKKKRADACRVPKCPTALNVRQIFFFSKSVVMMNEIIINSKINKYFKKIISEKYSESNLEKKMSDT